MKQLLLSEREAVALNEALELYIRLGLGQVTAVGPVLERLTEKRNITINHNLLSEAELALKEVEWQLQDAETASLTIAAFGIQAKLGDNTAAWEWACKRLHDNGDME
jgi:hypothetical protein